MKCFYLEFDHAYIRGYYTITRRPTLNGYPAHMILKWLEDDLHWRMGGKP